MLTQKKHDPNEAPNGYYAVPKDIAKPNDGGNICRSCDWRPSCQDPNTNFNINQHRCMSYPVVTNDGKTIERNDGCSVVFKKKE
jgi:hypothetical protein